MPILRSLMAFFLWPGNVVCRTVGQNPLDDGGMLRGFVNSIAWGLVSVVVLGLTL